MLKTCHLPPSEIGFFFFFLNTVILSYNFQKPWYDSLVADSHNPKKKSEVGPIEVSHKSPAII